MLSLAVSEGRLEADLAAGRLVCPDCSGRLSRWGFARSREVRLRDGVRSVRPRRAWCAGCEATHVLCPARGIAGIARQLDRPPGTVRGWLRAARTRAESLRVCAVRYAYALDPGELTAVTPAGSELGDAVEAIMLALRARVLRFGPLKTHRIGHGSWRCASPAGCSGGRPPLPP